MSKEKTNDKKYFYYNKKELKQLLKTLIEESEPLNSLYKELKDRENKLKQISKAQKKE
ncbi:MAG: hypothetical protein LRZ98_02400 [Candidatus Pacebacteria bacterium]|nr:hypothetical protein [Candidatus Paceibacterota bacterium]